MLRSRVHGVTCLALVSGFVVMHASQSTMRGAAASSEHIATHDNRTPAGELRAGVLTISLVAGQGTWFPERDAGPAHEVYAFGEAGRPLSNPGPLLRVPVGTEIRATLRNAIGDAPLVVHGLHDRPGAPVTVTVPAGGTATTRFRVTAPGTYLYWGTTRGARALRDRWGMESQLLGAFIVDPPGRVPDDHVMIVGVEDDSAAVPAQRHIRAAVVNGRSWPHSAITDVQLGDTVRMRWINASDRFHPMHLHGFYFRVDSRGDIAQDTIYDNAQQRLAVTELLPPGTTMAINWVAERVGNWLMHCHMAVHMSPELRLGTRPSSDAMRTHNHTLDVMAGLVTGWRVLPRGALPVNPTVTRYRHIRLLVQSAPRRYGAEPGLGFVLQHGDVAPRADSVVIPGPPLVLVHNEPVQITVVNRLAEPTSIHWHGIELESYFDGVSGWSGEAGRVAPHVAPRDSFIVRFTPPRAGTFIYHSHFDEERQLASGMYGALIVIDPGVAYDPETDRSWVLSQEGPAESIENARVMMNGTRSPVVEFDTDHRYRIRLININPNVPLVFSLLADSVPVRWRAIAKDGATLPEAQARVVPATVRIGVGETYDFEFTPTTAGELQIRASDIGGVVKMSGVAHVRSP